jgi:hypothetical protein
MSWEKSVRNMHETLLEVKNSQARLRHELPFASASLLAKQYYCEMKVEQEFLHGQVEKEHMKVGSALHEDLIQLVPVDEETLIENIKREEVTVISLPLLASFEGLAIAGTPDAVIFHTSDPLYLIELKTTRGRPNIWPEQWVQARIYAFLLDEMGFNCSSMRVLVASLNQRCNIDRERFIHDLIDALLQEKTGDLETKLDCRIRMEPYDRNFAAGKIRWAGDYWLMKRDAVPTDTLGKCRSCEFTGFCPSSLSK